MGLRILREWALGRFHGPRWFSWTTGVPVLMLSYFSGIVGLWLVWDKLGQFIAVRTSEWLDRLPIFATPMARNFLTNGDVTDLFFRLLIIMHIGLPLLLFIFLLLHIKRISHARIMPPRPLLLGTLAALLALALIQPVVSHARADLVTAPGILHPDWFYMFPYAVMVSGSMVGAWALFAFFTIGLAVLPWLVRSRPEPEAVVNLDYCSGCGLCAEDCPYEAIEMRERSDGHPIFAEEARVIPGFCVSCGICTGACPSSNPFRRTRVDALHRSGILKSGIEMPHYGIERMRREVENAFTHDGSRILLVRCMHAVDVEATVEDDTAILSVPCIGILHPAFIEHALRLGAAGVFLCGCRQGDCLHRFGDAWCHLRIEGLRRPLLRRTVDRTRLGFCWAAPRDTGTLQESLTSFRTAMRLQK